MDREANILRRFKVAPITAGRFWCRSWWSRAGALHSGDGADCWLLAHFLYGMPSLEHADFAVRFRVDRAWWRSGLWEALSARWRIRCRRARSSSRLLYFPMLFLGGATFPIAVMPNWLQMVAQFIPTTYLSTGLNGNSGRP